MQSVPQSTQSDKIVQLVTQLVALGVSELELVAAYRAAAVWQTVHSVAHRDAEAATGSNFAALVCHPEYRLSRER
jgi:hypothetical protein